MEAYQERVKIELEELIQKVEKLDKFLESPIAKTTEEVSLSLMKQQLHYMTMYAGVLSARVAVFKSQESKKEV